MSDLEWGVGTDMSKGLVLLSIEDVPVSPLKEEARNALCISSHSFNSSFCTHDSGWGHNEQGMASTMHVHYCPH